MAQIYWKIAISVNSTLLGNPGSLTPLGQAQEMADDMLKYLPPNTSINQIVSLAIISLSIPFMVVYDAPFFNDDQELDITYHRDIVSNGHTVHQWTTMTKIEYRPYVQQLPVGQMNTSMPQGKGFSGFDIEIDVDALKAIDSNKSSCNHEWIEYTGLLHSDKFCKHCNEKRS